MIDRQADDRQMTDRQTDLDTMENKTSFVFSILFSLATENVLKGKIVPRGGRSWNPLRGVRAQAHNCPEEGWLAG